MNQCYRKQMRLRSRHARIGHTPVCRCPEVMDRILMKLRRYQRRHGKLPTRTLANRSLES